MTDNTLKARLERCRGLQGKVEAGDTLYSPTGGVEKVVEVPKQDTRALQAEAWDEGYLDGIHGFARNQNKPPNPYRKGDE